MDGWMDGVGSYYLDGGLWMFDGRWKMNMCSLLLGWEGERGVGWIGERVRVLHWF